MRTYTLPFILMACLLCGMSYGLSAQFPAPQWEVTAAAHFSSGKQVPFWLMSNRQGKIYHQGNSGNLSLGLYAEPDTAARIAPEFGFEAYGRTGRSDDIWLHQAWAGVRLYDWVQVRAGLWEDVTGSRMPTLSSGSIIWSGNARPMPRVTIGTPGYVTLPFGRDMIELKGVVTHGWFLDDRFASDVWLHHKNAFIRLGGDLPVNIYWGLNHYAQWGGSSSLQEKPYPNDLEAFLRVIFIRSASPSDPGSPGGWVENKIGNHLGSRNHGVDITTGWMQGGLYLQDVMEDGSGWRRQNFPDGLWGAWMRFTDDSRPVQAIVYEYLQTTDQSGPTHDDEHGNVVGGNDNYFNHGHYRSGWSYHGHTIGTPLITSPILTDTENGAPESRRFTNNRVRAHHLGVKGEITGNLAYRTFFTYSRNYGRHSVPFDERKDHFSWMLELSRELGVFGLEAGLTVAVDRGEMYGDQVGGMVSLVRRGGLK